MPFSFLYLQNICRTEFYTLIPFDTIETTINMQFLSASHQIDRIIAHMKVELFWIYMH